MAHASLTSSPSPSTSNPSSADSAASSSSSKRKTLHSLSSSSSLLPRTTLLLANGTHVNLLAPSPFEPLVKGARWPDSRLEILKAAFDLKLDSIPSSVRRPLALYLAVPSTRINNWLQSKRGRKKKGANEKDSSSSSVVRVEGKGGGSANVGTVESSRTNETRVAQVEKDGEGSTTEEEEEEEVERPIKRAKVEERGTDVGEGVDLTPRVVEHREEIKDSTPSERPDAYNPPSSPSSVPHTEPHAEDEPKFEPDPSKPPFLNKLAILSLFQTAPPLPLPLASSPFPFELDLLSFDQPSDPLQQPGSSILPNLAHPVGRPPFSDLSLASLLLAARPSTDPSSSPSSSFSCPFSSSSNTQISASNVVRSSSSRDDDADLKRKAPSTPLPSQPPSKIVKITSSSVSETKLNGTGWKMDHHWLGEVTSGWFGEGWRWRKDHDASSFQIDGSGDVEMKDASSSSD